MKFQKYLILPLILGMVSCSDDDVTEEIDCAVSGLALSASGQEGATCTQGADVELTATGGVAPFTYSFGGTSFSSASIFTDVPAVSEGIIYIAIVKDANDCEVSINVNVAEAESTVTASLAMEPTGCTGTITVTAGGGDGSYMYQLDGGDTGSDHVFTGLSSGTHEVTVTDGEGCSTTETIEVTSQDGISITFEETDSGCGTSEGAITVIANGGDGNYTYQLGEATAVTGNVFSGLAEGTYQVTVADGSGCETVASTDVKNGLSYDASIKAIIQNSCATTGCHVSGGTSPNLTDFATIQTNADRIKARTGNKSMPAGGGSLTDDEIAMIACWVNDGALNN